MLTLMAQGDEVRRALRGQPAIANSFQDEDLQFLVAFLGLAAVAIGNSRYAERLRREENVRANFERYFAPNVAAEAHFQAPGRGRPGGRRGGALRRHPELHRDGGADDPDAIAALLTDYFTEMMEVIFEHGGTLDKFIGDALMALWGAPV